MTLSDEDKKKLEKFKMGIQYMMERQSMERRIKEKMKSIRYKIAILSGKGGVGKSTVTANLAIALALKGYRVGVFDSDFHGPSIPKMLGLERLKLDMTPDNRIIPVEGPYGIKVISIYYFLPDPTTAVVWRGPLKRNFLEELLDKTDFGQLDFLLFDLPPGCVSGDTEIHTDIGKPICISDIKPGDRVYSFNEGFAGSRSKLNADIRSNRVFEVIPQGTHRVFKLETRSRSLIATPNHPVLALRRTHHHTKELVDLEWVPLGYLREGDYVVVLSQELSTSSPYFKLEMVERISYAGEREVYDLHIENQHNFVANGIVVHNTGDEALNLVQVIPDLSGVIAVTQPTEVSAIAVSKSIDFARKLNIPILGVVENMSGFICPGENKIHKIFSGEAGKTISEQFDIPLLGRVPIDPRISEYGDSGSHILVDDPECEVSKAFNDIATRLSSSLEERHI